MRFPNTGIPVVCPPHRSVPARVVNAVPITEWPVGTFVENLKLLDDESALVSVVSSKTLERVALRDGARSPFATLPKEPTGIARLGELIFFNVGTPGELGWSIWWAGLQGDVAPFVDLPRARFLNGLARFSDTQLLAVDSILGEVFLIDAVRGEVTSWLAHEWLTKCTPEPMMPGVNGVKVVADRAYFTSTERALVLSCRIEGGRAVDLSVMAEMFVGDDFTLDVEGNLYITTHVHNEVQRLSPEGERVVLAGMDEHMHGATSCVLAESGHLYVTTTGGILAPVDGRVRPARLVRLDVDARPAKQGITTSTSQEARS